MTRKKRHRFFHTTLLYKHRRPLPHHTPIPSSCYPSPYLNSPPKSRNCSQTNLLALLESLIGCYKLETRNFSPSAYYSLMAYGNPTCNLLIGNCSSCIQSTMDMPKTKRTLLPTGAYISMTPWLFEGLLLARVTTHTESESNNTLTSNQLGTKPCTQTHDAIYSLISTIQYNKYTLQKPTYVAFVDYSTAYPSVHRDRLSSILLYNDIVGHMWHHLRARIDNIQLRVFTPTFKNIKQLTFSDGFLKVAASAPPHSAYLLLTLSMNFKLNFPTMLFILHLVSNTMEQRKFGLMCYCT